MLAVMVFVTSIFAIGQDDYKMLELVYLKPYPGADLEAASKLMADHNKKFHAEKPYKASVWSNLTGSRVGTWTWVMYPASFSAYDNRPSGKEHDQDWEKVVGPYFELIANEYWKVDDKLTYEQAVAGTSSFDLGGWDDWRLPTIKEQYSLILFSGVVV